MHRIRLTLCALLLVTSVAHAGIESAGTTTANFLSLGTGASVLSMGGAALGTGGSLHASAWNPAALGQLAGPQYSITHATLAMQSSQDWLAAGGRFRSGETRWSLNALYQNDGDFEGRDAFGASTGTFNASNLAMGAHVARPFGRAVVLGAGFQWVNEYLGEVTGTGLAFDVGVLANAGPFGFGAAARNVGGSMKFESGTYDMPQVFGVGASWASPARGLRFNLDANFPNAYYNDVRMGAEWMWQNRVALRTGYRMELNAPAGEPVGGPSFGLGAGSNSIWVDYAFLAGQSEAQGTHRVSFSLHPGFMNPGGLAMAPTPISTHESAPLAQASAPAQPQPVAVAEPRVSVPAQQPVSEPVAIVRASEPVVAPAPVVATPKQKKSERAVVAPPSVPAPAAPLPVAIVTPPLPLPAAKASARPVEPQVASAPAPAPVATPAPPTVTVTLPDNALAVNVAPRATQAADASLKPNKAARVPKLVVPRLESEPAPRPAAPVAMVIAPEKPRPVVSEPAPVAAPAPKSEPARPATQLASSAPVVAVVVKPADAPSTEPIARPAPSAAPARPQPRPESVVVKDGESLADIAKRWDTSVPAIMMENNLVTDRAKVGQKLKLPPPSKK